VARCQDAAGGDRVVGAVGKRQRVAETPFTKLAVDTLAFGFGQHGRGEVERIERREPARDQRDTEEAGAGAGVEDPPLRFEQTLADVGDGTWRSIVVRPGEVVVVDLRDSLVLGAELVEVAGAVEPIDVDPRLADGYTPRGERSSIATFIRSRIDTIPTTFPPATTGRCRKPPWIISDAA
jgi:hypothetical protein